MKLAIIEELICALKPFHRATTMMSASSYSTLSMLSPLLYKLLDIILKVLRLLDIVLKVKDDIYHQG